MGCLFPAEQFVNEQERKIRAEKAKQLLGDVMLADVFKSVEQDAIEAMISSPDDETRRRNADFVKAVRAVRGKLKSFVDDGKMLDRPKPGIA